MIKQKLEELALRQIETFVEAYLRVVARWRKWHDRHEKKAGRGGESDYQQELGRQKSELAEIRRELENRPKLIIR